MVKNSIFSPVFARRAEKSSAEGRNPPQELDVGLHSKPYLVVLQYCQIVLPYFTNVLSYFPTLKYTTTLQYYTITLQYSYIALQKYTEIIN